MQDMVGSLYAAKFDISFEEDPWASAAAESLGSLFLAGDNFDGNRWYKKNVFPANRRWFVGGSFIFGLMIELMRYCCCWAGEWDLWCWREFVWRRFGRGKVVGVGFILVVFWGCSLVFCLWMGL